MPVFGKKKEANEQVVSVGGEGESKHSFTEREKKAYVDYINSSLGQELDLTTAKILPINPEGDNLFDTIANGYLLMCVLFLSSLIPKESNI